MISKKFRIFLRLCVAALFLCAAQFAFSKDNPHIVFITGDHEYSSEKSMPLLAKALEKQFGMKTTVLYAMRPDGKRDEQFEENIPGLETLDKADLAVFFLRWRRLPKEQLAHIEKFLKAGRPIVGFRTATHAFNYPKGHELEMWNAFAETAFGAPPGWGGAAGHTHYGHESSTDVFVNPAAADNPILRGVEQEFHVRSWLYRVKPNYPPSDATELLIGRAVNPDKTAIANPVAWTWKNQFGGRVFFTTMGHPEDFDVESFQRVVVNGIHWALGRPVPEKWPGKLTFNVRYDEHGAPVK